MTIGTEELVAIEPGQLGERGKVGSESAFVTARGAHTRTFVILDAQAPRPLPRARTPLVMLVDEDAELAPGAHELTAFEERQGGLSAAHFGFTVAGDGKVADVEPIPARCVLALPRGTYRGADASNVRVIAIPSAGAGSLRLSLGPAFSSAAPVSGAPAKAGTARVETIEGPVGTSFALRALPSGDYALGLECLPQTEVATESRRVITIDAVVETSE